MTSDGHSRTALRHRHRRVDAERARLVARGGDDAAAVGLSADGERLAAQRRVVALLDRRVERVHVDVENASNQSLPIAVQIAGRLMITHVHDSI